MNKYKLTPQKLHSIIRAKTGLLCGKYSPSQKIDRTTYDVCNNFKYSLGVMSKHIDVICEALEEQGITYDGSGKAKGFITINRIQDKEQQQ